MTDDLVGRTIAARYRVVASIGQGATASVYRAEQDAEPREVALKCLHHHLTGDTTFVGRFRREANLAARLKHPNIVQLLDFGQDGPTFFIAMELLRGKELGLVLKVERRLAERRAATILVGALDALSVAHELGAIHRDLKPDNIILEPTPAGETVKVLDFGIAKIVQGEGGAGDSDEAHTALTKVGVAVGSPAYMSPEQCRGESTVGPRSDLYACGVLLYEMVTGRAPFTGDSPIDIAMGHIRQQPRPFAELVAGANPKLEAFTMRLLAKKQEERFATAAEARAALTAMLPELGEAPLSPAQAGPGGGTLPLGPSPIAQAQPAAGFAPTPAPPAAPGPQPQPTPAALAAAQPGSGGGSGLVWLLVPVSIVLGIGVGFAAFALSK